jgi:hypothetical protein
VAFRHAILLYHDVETRRVSTSSTVLPVARVSTCPRFLLYLRISVGTRSSILCSTCFDVPGTIPGTVDCRYVVQDFYLRICVGTRSSVSRISNFCTV